jgi:hypothetical protein
MTKINETHDRIKRMIEEYNSAYDQLVTLDLEA